MLGQLHVRDKVLAEHGLRMVHVVLCKVQRGLPRIALGLRAGHVGLGCAQVGTRGVEAGAGADVILARQDLIGGDRIALVEIQFGDATGIFHRHVDAGEFQPPVGARQPRRQFAPVLHHVPPRATARGHHHKPGANRRVTPLHAIGPMLPAKHGPVATGWSNKIMDETFKANARDTRTLSSIQPGRTVN